MKPICWLAGAVASLTAVLSFAQTTIDHAKVAYFVPEKRITINAGVTDPKGVKLARTYFKAGAQADYTFVPMQAAGPNRYVATLPAPSGSTPSIEYIVLAQNNEGAVSRTAAYTVEARKTNETPAWQSSPKTGEVKVFTEAAQAPSNVAGFTDSVKLDIVESGARLGAAAGLYSGATAGGGGAGAAAGTSTAATTGGLSTMAIVGGVAIAGVAAAAAGSGGGGGGGGGSSNPGGSTGNSFAGPWSGTWTSTSSYNNGQPSGTCGGTWSGNVDASGNLNGTYVTASGNECFSFGASFPLTGTISPTGSFSMALVACLPVNNANVATGSWSGTFSASAKTASGTITCPPSSPSSGVSGSWSGHSP
jgi:hypothetical protein